MINYSIIIPTRNIPELLYRCVCSIPERPDIQIIVVDDASNPDIDYCSYRFKSNVQVIKTKEGKGAGYARNVGLRHAVGRWLLFADSDDFFMGDFIDTLDKFLGSTYDIIFFKACSKDNESLQDANDDYRVFMLNAYISKAINENNYEILRWSNENVLNVPWCKMIRRDIVSRNNIEFEEVKVGNDAMFSLKSAYCANKIYAISRTLYCATVRKDSLTQQFNIEIMYSRFKGLIRINDYLRQIGHTEHRYNLIKMSYSYLHTNLRFFLIGLCLSFHNSTLQENLKDIQNIYKRYL